ncbi:glutamine synthetase [Candidatus Bathyarchaeota archaeon]|nr:glutamine synthetase [Candidatus Bathyarchaeota archaeon]
MSGMSASQVLDLVNEKDVKFIRIWFPSLRGIVKSFAITREDLEDAFEEGYGFDGSSIKGFQTIEESDMVAMPDPSTFQLLPWRPKEKAVARMFCDIMNPDGTPYMGDPRHILKLQLERAEKKGFNFFAGPELEYFYFKNDCACEGLDKGGYFDLTSLDAASDLRRDTILALEAMGIKVEMSHHEVAPSQHEIYLRYKEGLAMADAATTMRIVVKEIATKYSVYATFLPKPVPFENGSGMHTHQSLFKQEKNAFFDSSDPLHLSGIAKNYIGGLLKYVKEFAVVTNPLVNSYKRLVPGYEAPTYLTWSKRNRSAMIRVPMYKPGKEKATRIELRSPDPTCNLYLAFAVMLGAGLKGIEEGIEPPEPTDKNIFALSDGEKIAHGITALPGSLGEAVRYAEDSEFLKEVLGEHVFTNYLKLKKLEWSEYLLQVSPWELDTYLPLY